MIFIAKENKSTFVPASTPEGRQRQQAAIKANYAKKSAKSKKPKIRWNKVHFFKRKKSTRRKVGHPVYVYAENKKSYKYLTFTHSPEEEKEDDYVKLKHNIDPEETVEPSYLKKMFSISDKGDNYFLEPEVKYRIHEDDTETVKKYKK